MVNKIREFYFYSHFISNNGFIMFVHNALWERGRLARIDV